MSEDYWRAYAAVEDALVELRAQMADNRDLRARLAAVEALCDRDPRPTYVSTEAVRAAARGETS